MSDIKRLNYFNGQFLKQEDFNNEQDYHLEMRRRLNRTLHISGVADGLEVTGVGSTQVSVSDGTAIDKDGREIVLLESQLLTVDKKSAAVYITITHESIGTNPYTAGGLEDKYTRWTERPKVEVQPELPLADSLAILLARVTLDAHGKIREIDQTVRPIASSKIDPTSDLTVGKLAVNGATSLSDTLTVSKATTLKNGLAVEAGDTTMNGNLTVGGITKLNKGLTITNTPDPNVVSLNIERGITKIGGNLIVSGDALLGGKLGISKATTLGDTLTVAKTTTLGQGLVVASGNVGIGTPISQYTLDIKAGAAIKLGLEGNGGGQLILASNVNDNSIYLEALNTAGDGHATEFFLTGRNGANVPKLSLKADNINLNGNLDVAGDIRAGNSDIYFTKTDHNHTGFGNTEGWAAIENDSGTYKALMILGRYVTTTILRKFPLQPIISTRRVVKLWDDLQVNGNLDVEGNLTVTGSKSGYVVDRFVNNLADTLEEGDVVVIGENQTSQYYGLHDNIPVPEVDLTQAIYDTRVCGIVSEVHIDLNSGNSEEINSTTVNKQGAKSKATKSRGETKATKPSELSSEEMINLARTKVAPGQMGTMVTLGAFAHCKVDADIAPIRAGDLLTTSPTKGHAQKVLDPSKALGAIIGKALGSLEKGKGKIPVLVMLQ